MFQVSYDQLRAWLPHHKSHDTFTTSPKPDQDYSGPLADTATRGGWNRVKTMTPFLPLRLSSHQDLNSVPTLAPGLPASSTPTLNHTITPCCSRLPSPCLPILVSVLDISSVASEPLCPHKAQFLTFLEGFLPLGPLYKSKREALTSLGGKVICKICSRI